jgi:aspartyl-tRNA(Asn)/glutamyl-tRNA(Gln) amidotransferase subunit A
MGPLTRTVRDAAAVLNAIAGFDGRDPASSRKAAGDFLPPPGSGAHGLRIGIPENCDFERLDPEVDAAVRAALRRAESAGAAIRPVRVPDIHALNAVARVILLAEASAVAEPFLHQRNLFGPDVLALFDQGRLVPATDYIHAQRLRRKLRSEFAQLWRDVDCICTPTTPTTAPRIGQTTIALDGQEEDVRLATTRLVRGINALGLPALSIPAGVSKAGMPIGLQIVGGAFQEAALLRAGAALEMELPPCPICTAA